MIILSYLCVSKPRYETWTSRTQIKNADNPVAMLVRMTVDGDKQK